MSDSRSPSTEKGAAPGSLAAVIVGGLLVLAIGFVLGRYTGEGSGQTQDPAPAQEVASAAASRGPTSSGEPSPGLSTPADSREEEQVRYELDPPMLDFGIVPPATELRGAVKIRNISDRPLIIRDVKPDCKCTVIRELAGEVILPGEFLEMETVVEARTYPGEKTSKVAIIFDDSPPAMFDILSIVSRAVRAEPFYLAATDMRSGLVTISALDDRPFRILGANQMAPVYADGFNPQTDEPRTSYKIVWDLTGYDEETCENSEGERMPLWWVVQTDHPDAPLLDLRVRHFPCTALEMPKRDQGQFWVMSENRVLLDRLPAGEATHFEVFLKWPFPGTRPNDTIQRIESESDDFHASLAEVSRDGEKITCRVGITPRPGFHGLLYGVVRFHAYTPGHSMPVTVIGYVEETDERHAAAP